MPKKRRKDGGDAPMTRDELIASCMRLVWKLAAKHERRGFPREELAQVGFVALIEAAERFDLARGTKFVTYAFRCIDGRMTSYRIRDGLIRIPPDQKHSSCKSRAAHQAARERLIASLDDVDLEVACEPDNGQAALERAEQFERLHRVLARLPERDRLVLTMRSQGSTLGEIGEALGICQERARQIEAKAIEKAQAVILTRE